MQNLTDYLLKTRKSLGLSQTKLAKELGIPQTTWASYEIGKAKPPIKILAQLAQMGYPYSELTAGSAAPAIEKVSEETGLPSEEVKRRRVAQLKDLPPDTSISEFPPPNYKLDDVDFNLFKFRYGKTLPLATEETDENAMVLLPLYSQTAAVGRGQPPVQLGALADYIPIVYEMLGGSNPKDCGIVRVVGDSMTDMGLLDGDLAIFDRTRVDGDGVYVISIGTDVRIKHLEHRPIERKIVISSENAKRYPNPEIITYEQAENLLRIHGKVISWMHRHPY